MPSRPVRPGAVNASTVFAVVMAIVAGLIFTLVFKTVVLDRKPKVATVEPVRKKLTVAAVNLLDKMQIHAPHVKHIQVSEEEYQKIMNGSQASGRKPLTGNQPVGRVTVKPVNAEEPIFEDQLEPLAYPEPVSARVGAGKRAVVLEVPANSVMIQVGDRVDVIGTLTHDSPLTQGAATTTATLAKGLRVIARFNSTRTAAPPNRGPNRTYTIEATPYRAALLELAKNVGCIFSLPVSPRMMNEDGSSIAPSADNGMDDPQTDRVTVDDLAKIFGIKPPPPPPPTWTVERYIGVSPVQPIVFPGYSNTPPGAEKPGGDKSNSGMPPAIKPVAPRTPTLPPEGTPRRTAKLTGIGYGSVAGVSYTRGNNPYGFRAPPVAAAARGCKSCAGNK